MLRCDPVLYDGLYRGTGTLAETVSGLKPLKRMNRRLRLFRCSFGLR